MRACIMLVFAFLATGALTMSNAIADDKKFDPSDQNTYDEKVTVRKHDGKKLLNAVKDVPAHRAEVKGQLVMYVLTIAGNAELTQDSEVTDKDGKVYVVTKIRGITMGYKLGELKLKEKDKDN